MKKTAQRSPHRLHTAWRAALTVLGLSLLVLSVAIYSSPPDRVWCDVRAAVLTFKVTSATDSTTYCIALLATGTLFFVLASNGLSITRVSRDGLEMSLPGEDEVFTQAEHASDAMESDLEPPVSQRLPGSTFVRDGAEFQVFEADALPSKLVSDLLKATPPRIASVDDIAYGFRRIGRGNHAWFVTTRSGITHQVTYGGRGKTDATHK